MVNLAFWNTESLFIRDIHTKFGIPNMFQSLDIVSKTQTGVFSFSGQIQYKQKLSKLQKE